ncbi:MAG: helix-turn-helix transcriptional regulator [Gammaproteobacteria bacterium]
MNETELAEAAEPAGTVEPGELGRLLHSAREARGLSVEDLAHLLRLEPRIVRALESEDFERLPPPAFVRGYLRAIAKEYGMESAAFLGVFEQRAGNEEPELADFKSRAPLQMTSETNLVRYTTLALVLLLVVMVVLWWRAHDAVPFARDLPDAEPAVTLPEPAEPLPYEFPVVTHPDTPYAA